MKFVEKLAGMFLGGIQGIFMGSVLPWIIEAKPFFLHLLSVEYRNIKNFFLVRIFQSIKDAFLQREYEGCEKLIGAPIIIGFYALCLAGVLLALSVKTVLTLMKSVAGIFIGLAMGAYFGFKGGIVSSEDKKAPALDLFTIFKALAYYNDGAEKEQRGDIENYLTRKYHGFANGESIADNSPLLLRDLLDSPRYAPALIAVTKELSWEWKYGMYYYEEVRYNNALEFTSLKSNLVLNLCAELQYQHLRTNETHKLQEAAENLLTLLINDRLISSHDFPGYKEPLEALENLRDIKEFNKYKEVLLMPASRSNKQGHIPQTPLEEFYNNPLFDQNVFHQIFALAVPNSSSTEPAELKYPLGESPECEELNLSAPLLS